ncbi:MAG: hypothetical protein J6T98_03665 [Salinivirgaceae bacterium]|nr:hypothetical protein [Salinivirgaceae bacterium]
MGYKEKQCEKQQRLIETTNLFDGAEANMEFRGEEREFVLKDGKFNIYKPIREKVIKYFEDNGIQWWGGKKPSGHVLSSQIACINHLFPIRADHDLLLRILNDATGKNFSELLPIPEWLDKKEKIPHYVAFEAISKVDHLNEGNLSRGSNCTSVDALMIAKNNEGVWLIPIEWKYTELYANDDKSNEDREGEPEGTNSVGLERLRRYQDLIQNSTQLDKKYKGYQGTIYFQEPYYQLMRQTLWAELSMKDYKADKFLHLHIVPEANKQLLTHKFRRFKEGNFSNDMVTNWRSLLKDKDLYLCKDPKTIFDSIKDWYDYLNNRYWK